MANLKANELSDKQLQKLKRPDCKKWVRDGNGLALCLAPTGRTDWRQWYFIYTSPETGKRRYKPLGTYTGSDTGVTLAKARTEATKLLAEVKKSVDPLERERRDKEKELAADEQKKQDKEAAEKVTTVAELCDEYINKFAKLKREKSWKEDERILNKDVLPAWGDRKTQDIIRRDVMLLIEGMQGRGDGITTNTFKVIRRMFAYAVKKEIIPTTPCYAFEKGDELPTTTSRERTLSPDETKLLWTGLDNAAISDDIQRILKLILLTGQRSGEVASMHRTEINGRWWEFTPKETKITKEIPRKQRIYLTDTAIDLIGDGDGYVFKCLAKIEPNEDGTMPEPRHITERAISHAVRRNLLGYEPKKLAVAKPSIAKQKRKNPFIVAEDRKINVAHFVPHDLRRTAATMMSELGFSDATVDAVLAHLKKGEIRTYNKNKYDVEKQQALSEWGIKLDCILTDTEYRNPQQRREDAQQDADKSTQEVASSNVVDFEEYRQSKAA